MWNKPKNWGGYKTEGNKFYIQTKSGIKIYEDDKDFWALTYSNWLKGDKNLVLFGLESLI